jgi:glucose-1-phosphate thymidylyltransferase
MHNYRVIIPAAGKATRMRPLSSAVSKAMVPVNGKPIISYIIDQLFELGNPTEIVIVHNELGDIKNFVKNAYPHLYEESRIKFAQQVNPEGPLHAIKVGADELDKKLVGEEEMPVMVWLGDTICLENNLDLSKSFLVTSPVEDYQRWCLVDDECNLYDKPALPPRTDKALIGIYYFSNEKVFWSSLDKGMDKPKHKGEYQISSLLNSYLEAGQFFDLEVTDEWYDCGELRTFYESKAKLLNRSARAFNHIAVDTFLGTVTKTADTKDKKNKIQMEKDWFTNLPETSALFCPRILMSDVGTLVMSQEPGTPLNEMWLYDNLRFDVWTTITDKILKIHNEVFAKEGGQYSSDEECQLAMEEMYITKNLRRLNEMKANLDYKLPEFDKVYEFVKETGDDLVASGVKWTSYLHGDSHLGNLLFEPLQGSIKLVDPRGKFGHIAGSEGDLRYDMAKMTQDFYLNYADILAGNFAITGEGHIELFRNGELSNQLCMHLRTKFKQYGYDPDQIFKLAIVLMVTCIPFHADSPDRQKAFWIMALNRIQSL